MDKRVIQEFWKKLAESGSTRWTGGAMLDFDRELLAPLVRPDASILDLGSGMGELSKSLCGATGRLVAVDHEPAMASGFEHDSRFQFVRSNIEEFKPIESFDVVLLFGVVTHLSPAEEARVYTLMARTLVDGGVVVVKNQCADSAAFEVDHFSEALGQRYVGRYPALIEQRELLERTFANVEPVVYPRELKMHQNSTHVAFVCRNAPTA